MKPSKRLTPRTLRIALDRLKMTQTELAAAMGVSPNTIWRKVRTDGKAITITTQDEMVIAGLLARRGLAFPR